MLSCHKCAQNAKYTFIKEYCRKYGIKINDENFNAFKNIQKYEDKL